jgi:hypothetical protein
MKGTCKKRLVNGFLRVNYSPGVAPTYLTSRKYHIAPSLVGIHSAR